MAKLSAHGNKVGQIDYLTYSKAYMSDGKVLKNSGFGWKLCAKVKPGVDVAQAFANKQRKQAEYFAEHPAYAAYRAALHDLAGLCKRWKLHTAITMMPDDYDGVWSEACDGYGDNVSASVDEVAKVCILYAAAMSEQQSSKQPQATEQA